MENDAHLRNISIANDHDVAINDIKDDNPKAKNITVPMDQQAEHQQTDRSEHQPNTNHSAAALVVEGVTEKRAKYLVDPGDEPRNSSAFNSPEWSLTSLKGVGEVSSNNVTTGRFNESGDALKTLADLVDSLEQSEGKNMSSIDGVYSTTSADGLLHKSLLHDNSSRIDDSVHQDNSINSFQVTTVAPRTNTGRTASITRKELDARRISDDVSVFNRPTGTQNVTKEKFSQAGTDLNQSAQDGDKVALRSEETTDSIASTQAGKTEQESREIPTTPLPSTETTELPTTTNPLTTTEMEDETTTDMPELTTIPDEITTTNPSEPSSETTTPKSTSTSPAIIRTIPKRTTISAEPTSTAIPDLETTTFYSSTISNRVPEVEEAETTISPETTTLPATSTRTTNADDTSTSRPTLVSLRPTTSSTAHIASVRPTDKLNLEISTTAIDLNRQEDKYSTVLDPANKKGSPSKPDETLVDEATTTGGPTENDENEDGPSNTTQAPISAGNPVSDGLDVNAIIAISVSIVGVIALILLVAFLFIMRKRQKQLTYGQRCRPVGLDAYSLDNISVYNSVRRKGALRSSKRAYGNAAFDDPGLKNNLLNISSLGAFVQKKMAIYDEFKDVPLVTARIDEVPAGCEDKNR